MSGNSRFDLQSRSGIAGPLKIALVAHLKHPIAEPFSGGLEMHTHLLATKFAERGHDVTLLAAAGSDSTGVPPVCDPTGQMERDPILSRTIDVIEYKAYSSMIPLLRNGAFDLIHFNALHFLPLVHAQSFATPVVAVLHTPPFPPLEAVIGSAGDYLTCVSVSKSLALQWPLLARPPTIIDNGIDLSRFPFMRPDPDDPFAVWSGRIVPEKGLHLAIEAARRAAIPLKIAGPINDRAYWDDEIVPRLDGNAVYVGHLDQSALAKLVGMARVALCTPRWEEPFGLVVVEALACGTPVAGFRRGALPEILDDTCGALAPADDVDALAEAIGRCLDLDRRACRNRAETRFDAELMIDRYETLYLDLVSAWRTAALSPATGLFDGAAV